MSADRPTSPDIDPLDNADVLAGLTSVGFTGNWHHPESAFVPPIQTLRSTAADRKPTLGIMRGLRTYAAGLAAALRQFLD